MLASIRKNDNGGFLVQYDRPLPHAAAKVWAALTENHLLEKWMSNLQTVDLRQGGVIRFHMNDGTGAFENLEITDYEAFAVLAFTWGADRVRFEVSDKPEGSLLVLQEFVGTLTEHTPKDLAGWHVCLDMLSALLDGQAIDFPMDQWKVWYEKYIELVHHSKE
ncbi:SRPBCC family protein [Paenibacillus sp. GCM10023248]|uniref:SRPBCC family protein n=1 Tax=Bacillales TaxID=1385 RepID=UPI00237805F2|nr:MULTISPECIES: SRPBCC family protein [Bacillales]MDD9272293.1 SRPBCC family protein [Paenibacillus sp. MAHUQ-63]MDR6883218.1 uncharacterized protein YndB with AHSA1/START domain [Bacillus sp. 3255]